MDQKKQPRPLSLEDIFAEAAERVQAGEPVDSVIASYAPEFHKPLRGLLPIVETASQLHHAEIPAIPSNRRLANRQALLQAAAQKRAHITNNPPPLTRRAPVSKTPTWRERLATFWSSFQASFAPSPMRLAMSVLALAVLIFGPTTLVTQAQSAIPGDLTYPVKQWVRAQEIAFTPMEHLAELRKQHEAENRADIEKAQAKADQQNLLISSHAMLVFHGYVGEYWQIGGLHVKPCYQQDLSTSDCQRMSVAGDLQPGAVVMLTYQILPGQPQTQAGPLVQGIALEVMKQQPTEQQVNAAAATATPVTAIALPTPTNTPIPPTDTPTMVVVEPPVTAEPGPDCTVGAVAGWVPVSIAAGETLAMIAARYGVTEGELRVVNCLSGEQAPVGLILVPNREVATPEATATTFLTITVETPTGQFTATPVPNPITPTMTSPVTDTAVPPTLPAVTSTAVVTTTSAATPVSTPLATAVPLSTTVPTLTSAATPAHTGTPPETPSVVPPNLTPTPSTEPPGTPAATITEATTAIPVETPTEDGVSTGAAATPVVEPPTPESVATAQEPAEPPTTEPEPPTATAVPLPTEPPPLSTATPAGATEGVMAAEALPTGAEETSAEAGASDGLPTISQPTSPLQTP